MTHRAMKSIWEQENVGLNYCATLVKWTFKIGSKPQAKVGENWPQKIVNQFYRGHKKCPAIKSITVLKI